MLGLFYVPNLNMPSTQKIAELAYAAMLKNQAIQTHLKIDFFHTQILIHLLH